MIDTLKDLHFNVITAEILLQSRLSQSFPEQTVTTETQLTNGIKLDQNSLVDAIFTVKSLFNRFNISI